MSSFLLKIFYINYIRKSHHRTEGSIHLLMDNSSAEEDAINIHTVPSMNLSPMTRCTFPLAVIWLVGVERKLSLNETSHITIMDYVEELGHYFSRQELQL